jgi:hypothetical protein
MNSGLRTPTMGLVTIWALITMAKTTAHVRSNFKGWHHCKHVHWQRLLLPACMCFCSEPKVDTLPCNASRPNDAYTIYLEMYSKPWDMFGRSMRGTVPSAHAAQSCQGAVSICIWLVCFATHGLPKPLRQHCPHRAQCAYPPCKAAHKTSC